MQYMMKVLIDNNIPRNVGIAIEFKIPNTSKKGRFYYYRQRWTI